MEDSNSNGRLSSFLESGIYRLHLLNAVFVDPVRVLNRCYTQFRLSPSRYYSRFFDTNICCDHHERTEDSNSKKRKRKENKKKKKKKEPPALNERELAADERHRQVRPLLLKAHECLMGAGDLLAVIRDLRNDFGSASESGGISSPVSECSLIELGSVWQAPFYEITLNLPQDYEPSSSCDQQNTQRVVAAFNNLVGNEMETEVVAQLLGRNYIIPRDSCFYMSDLGQIRNLIPAEPHCGFNLIVIDPPWENASVRQKLMYPTLPNRHFFLLPIKQLSHVDGALVCLWVTNREKLRTFVEKELLPAWGVSYMATFYWLKVKADGSLLSDLDLLHHKPYECLLLGYCHGKGDVQGPAPVWQSSLRHMKADQIILSIPGAYSRKPPVGELLLELVPGLKPARCIELFAREMIAGWTSWGNEPLHFQDSCYFLSDD
ncbi:hypothetical protein K2173_007563 [Erythroxylum novogranatense]|uniref:Methyltransferase-like protein 2 n=1 Tax=Erythroxylum novogranatense TaxID=1862640 RepID=A0AAV8T727_9ROSI|nr:hypothetical protein K2173_007563 [Erythroxylum novogranatense]